MFDKSAHGAFLGQDETGGGIRNSHEGEGGIEHGMEAGSLFDGEFQQVDAGEDDGGIDEGELH